MKCYLFLETEKIGAMCCWVFFAFLTHESFPAKPKDGQCCFKWECLKTLSDKKQALVMETGVRS